MKPLIFLLAVWIAMPYIQSLPSKLPSQQAVGEWVKNSHSQNFAPQQ